MYFWLWIAVFFLAFVLEILTAGSLVSIWFSFGAIFALIANYFGLSFVWQIVVFILGSVLFFIIFKPLLEKMLSAKKQATNYDRYLGKRYRLIKAIDDEKGEIKINDLIYNVISNNGEAISKGEFVEVLAFEGSKIIVRKVETK